jgi:hypothetical protein
MGCLNRAVKIPGLSRFSKEEQDKILFRNASRLYQLKLQKRGG